MEISQFKPNVVSQKGMEREEYYTKSDWDGDAFFGEWFKLNWYLVDGNILDLIKLYRILDQVAFMSKLNSITRQTYIKKILQDSVSVVIAAFEMMLKELQIHTTQLKRTFELSIGVAHTTFEWDGEILFSDLVGNNWHKVKDEIIPTLKICRLIDQVLFTVGISLQIRQQLMGSSEILSAKKARELVKEQLFILEAQLLRMKIHLDKQTQIKQKKTTEENGNCIIQ